MGHSQTLHLYYLPHFDFYTDFNPMTYLLTSGKVNATGQQWENELSNSNFSIHYKPGIENIVTDLLSRYPLLQECNLKQYSRHFNPDEVKPAFDAVFNQIRNNQTWVAAVNTMNTKLNGIENQILNDVEDQKTILVSQNRAKCQAEKEWIQLVIQFKKKGESPDKHTYQQLSRESTILFRVLDNLQVH